jgi:redox-sensitive bicupin YhaK (pirin superfamily)
MVGEVQRMSAGTGVVHSEINASGSPCRLLQIWIEPSSRGIDPAYEQKKYTVGEDWTLLIDPAGSEGAMAIHRPVRLWRAQPSEGSSLELPLEAGRKAWLQLIEGGVDLDAAELSQVLRAGDGYGFPAPATGRLTVTRPGTDLLLFELA